MKKWYESKTVWANIIAGVATVAGVFGLDLGITPEVQAQIVAGIMTVVNIGLRFVTDQPMAPVRDAKSGLR